MRKAARSGIWSPCGRLRPGGAQISAAIVAFVCGLLLSLPASAQMSPRAKQIAAPLLDQHPVTLFQAAQAALEAGTMEDSVALFYLGQLRWRRYMRARPDLPPDRDPALYAAMHDVLGRPINEWAFGDIDALVILLRDVKAWDAATPDPLTPVAHFAAIHADLRSGFAAFIDEIEADADSIRAERLRNGLENRR